MIVGPVVSQLNARSRFHRARQNKTPTCEIHSKSLTFITFSSIKLITTSRACTSMTIRAFNVSRALSVSSPRTSSRSSSNSCNCCLWYLTMFFSSNACETWRVQNVWEPATTTWPGQYCTHCLRGLYGEGKHGSEHRSLVCSTYFEVVLQWISNDLTECFSHYSLDFAHPIFDVANRIDILSKPNRFLLSRIHRGDAHIIFEFDLEEDEWTWRLVSSSNSLWWCSQSTFSNAVEQLWGPWFERESAVVRRPIRSRSVEMPFVSFPSIRWVLSVLVRVVYLLHVGYRVDALRDTERLLPDCLWPVSSLYARCVPWFDIVSIRRAIVEWCLLTRRSVRDTAKQRTHDENILFAAADSTHQPRTLTSQPFVEHLLSDFQFVFPGSDTFFKRFLEWRERHRLCGNNVIIEHLRDVFRSFDNERAGLFVRQHVELHWFPFVFHLV